VGHRGVGEVGGGDCASELILVQEPETAAMKAMRLRAEIRFCEGVQIFELREVGELRRDCAIERILK